MRALSPHELLEIWDRAAGSPAALRALALLAGACPEAPPEALACLSVGRRDELLLALRDATFGPELASVAPCPACGERLESFFDSAGIRAGNAEEPAGELAVSVDGWEVRFRLPDNQDLAALETATGLGEEGADRGFLLARCVLAAEHDGRPTSASELPERVVTAIAESMERADPQADVQLALTCPACGHRWSAVFDVLSYFWSEIATWAERTLYEVHVLASAYGWREADVLALSPRRRQAYLRMVYG